MMTDPVNLLLLTSLAGLVSLLVLGSLARSGIPGIADCLCSTMLLIVATLLFSLRGRAPDFFSLVLANACMLGAICALYGGCRRLFGLPVRYAKLGVASALTLAGVSYFHYVHQDITIRVALVSGFYSVLCLQIAVMTWRHRTAAHSRYGHSFLTGIALFCAAGHAVRAVVYLAALDAAASLIDPTAWNVAFMTLGVLAMPSLIMGMVLVIHDRMLSESRQAASTDFLTRTLSRRAFFQQAQAMLEDAGRQGAAPALLMLDLDRFKAINDQHGHAAGDAVLCHFAALAQVSLREGDRLCRLGGEEFALLYRPGGRGDFLAAAERLRAQLVATPCCWGEVTLPCSFSAGLVTWRPGESLDRLLARADQGLYVAKQAGRNRIVSVGEQEAGLPGFICGGYRAS